MYRDRESSPPLMRTAHVAIVMIVMMRSINLKQRGVCFGAPRANGWRMASACRMAQLLDGLPRLCCPTGKDHGCFANKRRIAGTRCHSQHKQFMLVLGEVTLVVKKDDSLTWVANLQLCASASFVMAWRACAFFAFVRLRRVSRLALTLNSTH